MRFAWIQEHQKEYAVKILCQIAEVSRSGFYAWQTRPPSVRAQRIATLIGQIRVAHQKSRGTYGSPRVTVELKAQQVQSCRNTVAKYMREAGIRSRIKRRFVPCTTESDHSHPVARNLLDRNFAAAAPNAK